jgi:uncharacterized membrane protein
MEARRESPPLVGRRAHAVALALALLGLVLSVILRVEGAHREAYGSAFACPVQGTFDCEAVLTSKYGRFLGVPLATWGILSHLALAGLLAAYRAGPAPLALAGGLAIVAALGCVTLFLVSWLAIGAFCPYCEAVHAADVALAAILFRPARRALASLAGPAPLPLVAQLLAGAAVLAALGESFGRAWAAEAALRGATAGTTQWIDLSDTITLGTPGAPVDVVLYVDFGCPHCARSFEEVRGILADPVLAPKVRVRFKHMPLDLECNVRVNTTTHRGACRAAAAAQIAHGLGKGAEAMAFLFDKQGLGYPKLVLAALSESLGLPNDAIERRLADPAIASIVTRDIEEAYLLGVRHLPGVFVNGRFVAPDAMLREIRREASAR